MHKNGSNEYIPNLTLLELDNLNIKTTKPG